MANQSITLLPRVKSDLAGVSDSLQTTVQTVSKIVGLVESPLKAKLSELETEPRPASSIPGALAGIAELRKANTVLQDSIAAVQEQLDVLANTVSRLESFRAFEKLISYNFNASNWQLFEGLAYEEVEGADLSNPPTGVVLAGAAVYEVFMSVDNSSAFSQTLHLIGNSQNRVFKRSGVDFTTAVSNGWKEL